MVIKQLSAETRRLNQALLEEIKVDFRATTSSVAHGATEQNFIRRVLTKVMKSQTKQLTFKSLTMKNQVIHWQYSIELQTQKTVCFALWMEKIIPHLLNILGLVTLAHHAISLISSLSCMM